MVERKTNNLEVVGSNPSVIAGIKMTKKLIKEGELYGLSPMAVGV